MGLLPLLLSPLSAPGFEVRRGTLRWVRDQGATVQLGEPLAWCQVHLAPAAGARHRHPLHEDSRDLQAVLVANASGTLTRGELSKHGGMLDLLATTRSWDPGQAVGSIAVKGSPPPEASAARTVLLAGRRFLEPVEMRGSLAAGWFDRMRAWWGEDATSGPSVLGLGTCELLPLFRGDSQAFLELAAEVPGALHAVHIRDNLLVPAAPVVLGQLRRTQAERRAIADCFLQLFQALRAADSHPASGDRWRMAQDWMWFSALLTELTRASPIAERHTVIDGRGVRELGPPQEVVLSLSAESASLFRHKRLGFTFAMHGHRTSELSDEIKGWLRREFELCRRTVDQVKNELRALCTEVRSRTGARVLILNMTSSHGADRLYDYSLFEAPLAEHVLPIWRQELNLAAQDLERESSLEVLDVDALAAELGGREGLPDEMHQSGELQMRIRSELVCWIQAGTTSAAPR